MNAEFQSARVQSQRLGQLQNRRVVRIGDTAALDIADHGLRDARLRFELLLGEPATSARFLEGQLLHGTQNILFRIFCQGYFEGMIRKSIFRTESIS